MAVVLRPLVAADWERVHEWAAPEAACRFQPWGPNTPTDTQTFVAAATEAWAARSRARRVYASEAEDGSVVGLGELKVRSVEHQQAEIAYAVHVALWGRGFGEAIARALITVAASDGMHRVAATCDPRNIASGRVLQKVGMAYEGRLRHTLRLRDGWRDSDVYGLILDER